MYHPAIVSRKRAEVRRLFDRVLPHGLRGYTPEESLERANALSSLPDKRGRLVRPLTPGEQEFITVERLRSKIDFRWARYCDQHRRRGQGPLYPTLAIAGADPRRAGETGAGDPRHRLPDGLFVNILKARQLGASTLSEALMAHRITTHANFHVVIAADVPDTSTNLFDMRAHGRSPAVIPSARGSRPGQERRDRLLDRLLGRGRSGEVHARH
jgi:hypothetical protein